MAIESMTVESFFSVLDSLEEIEVFCARAKNNLTSPDLALKAEENIEKISKIRRYLNENLEDRDLARSPDDEIFRRPYYQDDIFSQRPIFIIGYRRSGTTLLSYLLNASDNICAMPENFFASELISSDRLLRVAHRLSRNLREPYESLFIKFGKFVDDIYLQFCKKNGKTRWASKELFISERLDALDAMFDYRAQFIYIARHGLNAAYSCSSRFPHRDGHPLPNRSSLNLDIYLDEWISNNEATMDFHLRNSDRCHFVRYEDLCADPVKISEKIFNFLGEPWTKGILSAMEAQKFNPLLGDNKISSRGMRIQQSADTWRVWPRGFLMTLARRANPTLERLGYAPIVTGDF
jgi:hypothetical protein